MINASYLVEASRFLIALIFALSFVGKVTDVTSFEATIASFKMLSTKQVMLAAKAFLTAELAVVALLLLGGPLLSAGFALALLLLALFVVVLSTMLLRHLQVSCNCFGQNARMVSVYDVIRNILLIAVCLVGLLMAPAPPPTYQVADALLLGLMVASLGVVLVNFSDVAKTLLRSFEVW